MIRIETDLLIDAPLASVWAVLMDFESYPAWNPFIIEASGVRGLGERLSIRVRDPAGSGRIFGFRPQVVTFEPERAFGWLGGLPLPALFDGLHWFRLEATAQGTRLVHGEDFSGLVIQLMGRARVEAMAPGYAAMNGALAREVARRC